MVIPHPTLQCVASYSQKNIIGVIALLFVRTVSDFFMFLA